MALQAPEPLPPVQQVPLRFVLPGTSHMVEGMGEVIWADDGGRAGMLFSRLTPASRKYLKQWFVKRRRQEESCVTLRVASRKLAALPQLKYSPRLARSVSRRQGLLLVVSPSERCCQRHS